MVGLAQPGTGAQDAVGAQMLGILGAIVVGDGASHGFGHTAQPSCEGDTHARELRTLPVQLRRSLTYDQGAEMREHRLFTKQTKMRVYFAHPHCPGSGGRMRTRMACSRILTRKTSEPLSVALRY